MDCGFGVAEFGLWLADADVISEFAFRDPKSTIVFDLSDAGRDAAGRLISESELRTPNPELPFSESAFPISKSAFRILKSAIPILKSAPPFQNSRSAIPC